MSLELGGALEFFQNLGLLGQLESGQLESKLDSRWGLENYLGAQPVQRDLMLVSLDEANVWHRDIKYWEKVAPYRSMVEEWAKISQGHFSPEVIVWDESLATVAFEHYSYRFSYRVAPGHSLDTRLVEAVNQSLCGSRRFEVCDGLGTPNTVVFVDQVTRERLQQRGWHFVDWEQGWLDGYVSTFFEQGMEEPAWRIFQDSRYCESPTEGWDRSGMQQLGEAQEIMIWNRQGEQVWSGPLRHRRLRWFRRLVVNDHRWHPPNCSFDEWDRFFLSHPPLRARWRQIYTP